MPRMPSYATRVLVIGIFWTIIGLYGSSCSDQYHLFSPGWTVGTVCVGGCWVQKMWSLKAILKIIKKRKQLDFWWFENFCIWIRARRMSSGLVRTLGRPSFRVSCIALVGARVLVVQRQPVKLFADFWCVLPLVAKRCDSRVERRGYVVVVVRYVRRVVAMSNWVAAMLVRIVFEPVELMSRVVFQVSHEAVLFE